MRSRIRVKKSFSTLLLVNYIMFTLILIFIILGIIGLTLFKIGKIAEVEKPADYKDALISGKYKEIPVERLAGKGGSFIVINEENEIEYKSNPNSELSNLNEDEIKYIHRYVNGFSVTVSDFYTTKNEKQISIIIEGENNGKQVEDRYILNTDRTILYNSTADGKTKFSKNELALLTNSLQGDFIISPFQFQNIQGDDNTVIVYQSYEIFDSEIERLKSIMGSSGKLFMLLYSILIVIFMLWFQRKVRKPLSMLQKALVEFSKGERQQYLSYKGPSEFVDIFESFNEMSRRLHKSEFERMKAEEDKKKMLADISHDLKTPITVIQGYAKAISDGIIPDAEKTQYMNVILQKSIAMNELINTFHEYSKMDHPNYKLDLEPYDIFIFSRDYMAERYNEFDLAGFNLEIEIPEEHILCYINKIQLKRAFDNIISNVIKHNDTGTTMYCSLALIKGKIKITFADNGYGIPEEAREDIFKPFSVGEKSRNKHSSGLGLAISKKIIEAHNGEIILKTDVESKYQTEFEITLPIKRNQKGTE